jgi:hypothetical protein
MIDSYFDAEISEFSQQSPDEILGRLTRAHQHELEHLQRNAWLAEVDILKSELSGISEGHLFLEFIVPRMGKRADVVLVIRGVIYVVEFKVGSSTFDRYAVDQVHDYALDLKNFHLGSHDLPIVPLLVATQADREVGVLDWASDDVATPLLSGVNGIRATVDMVERQRSDLEDIDVAAWRSSGYRPTPTIIEAAEALYQSHAVEEIARSDAGAKNLQATSAQIAEIIETSKRGGRKSICFITGVPGAGKTLAGLNIAAKRAKSHEGEHAVFLSGNGPLVDVLREALARDQVVREKVKKTDAQRAVRQFIQNIHHFRDHYVSSAEIPFEKVVVFDEAQRAWTSDQASKFMRERHGLVDFDQSEPEFLISVMDRHKDWCTIICLIGGGQEINTGEAGMLEWLTALQARFSDWDIHASSLLEDKHYTVDPEATKLLASSKVVKHPELHLSVSMRSFRAERLSSFVSSVLDNDQISAKSILTELLDRYPIWMTRDLNEARSWLRQVARGSERYGLVASSGAQRLRPEGVHVKSKIDPASWFLNDRLDVRSSFYLEDVATEFDIQGLELDWVGVCWDADLRYQTGDWHCHAFRGSKWQNVKAETRKRYLVNAYRVLLTRARQGMVLFVPKGDDSDPTRSCGFYDETFRFLLECGVPDAPRTPQKAQSSTRVASKAGDRH